DKVAEKINAMAGRVVAAAHHSEHKLTSSEMAGFDVLVITHQAWAYRRSRPPIPTDRDHLFRMIATSSEARVLTAPLDDGGDVSLLGVGQARRGAVPVVNRRDPRTTRRALTADAAARAGGPC
ncbi:MAG TPA: hypothetical protein VM910_37520, partial [Bradyrhizobium sp.]|nr:hypothetical protein [Bradyrhizobium sp.]